MRRDRHYTVPLAVPFAFWPAAVLLHAFHAALYAVIAGGALLVALAFLAPHKWTRKPELAYVLTSALAAWLWLSLAAWLSPAAGMPGLAPALTSTTYFSRTPGCEARLAA